MNTKATSTCSETSKYGMYLDAWRDYRGTTWDNWVDIVFFMLSLFRGFLTYTQKPGIYGR